MISLPKIPYVHRIYMVLANPSHWAPVHWRLEQALGLGVTEMICFCEAFLVLLECWLWFAVRNAGRAPCSKCSKRSVELSVGFGRLSTCLLLCAACSKCSVELSVGFGRLSTCLLLRAASSKRSMELSVGFGRLSTRLLLPFFFLTFEGLQLAVEDLLNNVARVDGCAAGREALHDSRRFLAGKEGRYSH